MLRDARDRPATWQRIAPRWGVALFRRDRCSAGFPSTASTSRSVELSESLVREQYARGVLERWIRLVIKRRVIVIAIWAGMTIVGAFSTTHLTELSRHVAHRARHRLGPGERDPHPRLPRERRRYFHGGRTVHERHDQRNRGAREQGQRSRRRRYRPAPSAKSAPSGGLLYANVNTSMDLGQAANVTGQLRTALARRRDSRTRW